MTNPHSWEMKPAWMIQQGARHKTCAVTLAPPLGQRATHVKQETIASHHTPTNTMATVGGEMDDYSIQRARHHNANHRSSEKKREHIRHEHRLVRLHTSPVVQIL